MKNFDDQIVVRIDKKTKERLKKRAARESRAPGAMARLMIQRALQKEKL